MQHKGEQQRGAVCSNHITHMNENVLVKPSTVYNENRSVNNITQGLGR